MKTETRKTADEAESRALIEDRVNAVAAKNVRAVMHHHASDVLMFDVVNPLQYVGADTVRARAQQ